MSRRIRFRTIDISTHRLRLLATAARASLAVRVVIALFGGVAGSAVPDPNPLFVVLLAAAILITMIAPDQVGAAFVIGVCLLYWTTVGAGIVLPTGRTITFAVALYLVHETTSLAIMVPAGSNVSAAVVWRWARGCVPGLVAAVFAAAALDLIGRHRGSPVIDVIGVLAATAVVGSVLWMLRSLRETR